MSYYQPSVARSDRDVEPSIPNASDDKPKVLTVGYGSGGHAPQQYVLRERQDTDVGFLKLFVTTRYVRYDGVAQDSPFKQGGRTGGPHIRTPSNAWNATVVPVIQKRRLRG